LTLLSRVLGRLAALSSRETADVAVERNLEMTAPDGVVLLADRWYPEVPDAAQRPVVVLRSPYGRRQLGPIARLIAERGYQVVVQSCRGTFGSGGEWVPFRNEAADGQATYRWLAEQPWFCGTAAGFGPSYLGLTQWSVAADPPPALKAIAPNVTARRFRDIVVFPGGSFTLETGATWLYLLQHQELGLRDVIRAQFQARRRLGPAYTTLPLAQAEHAVLGRRVDFYQNWLEHDRLGDPWWDEVDFSTDAARVPPASLVGGWYDIFLPAQIDDYVALREAGRTARLTVGPWTHSSPRGALTAVRDGIEWFDEHLRGAPPARAKAVRLWVIGRDKWVDIEQWPPPATTERWYLQADGRLAPQPPDGRVGTGMGKGATLTDRFRYDPSDPTPGIGGPSLNAANAGSKDQAAREQRPDVLTYTSDPLRAPMTVAGPLAVELWVRPSVEFIDVHVRLCTVDDRGRSRNLSDGILRLQTALDPADPTDPTDPTDPAEPPGVSHGGAASWGEVERTPDGTLRVRLRMWPTAVMWKTGQRIRLQVSAGAHPLFVRNLGGGERLGSGTRLVVVDQQVFRDAAHPSSIELPVSPI
jgi:putative CocE/NonD family hydrolase